MITGSRVLVKCKEKLWSQANRDNVHWSISNELGPNKWAAKRLDGAIGRLLVSCGTQLLPCIENSRSDLLRRSKNSLVFSQLDACLFQKIFSRYYIICVCVKSFLCFSQPCLAAKPAEGTQCTRMTLDKWISQEENKAFFYYYFF